MVVTTIVSLSRFVIFKFGKHLCHTDLSSYECCYKWWTLKHFWAFCLASCTFMDRLHGTYMMWILMIISNRFVTINSDIGFSSSLVDVRLFLLAVITNYCTRFLHGMLCESNFGKLVVDILLEGEGWVGIFTKIDFLTNTIQT